MYLTQLAMRKNEMKEVIHHGEHCLACDPHNLIARISLITAYVSSLQMSKAIPLINSVISKGLDRVPNPEDFYRLRELCSKYEIVS